MYDIIAMSISQMLEWNFKYKVLLSGKYNLRVYNGVKRYKKSIETKIIKKKKIY